jgi:hemerythrin HHE cation binding domain-containing protein
MSHWPKIKSMSLVATGFFLLAVGAQARGPVAFEESESPWVQGDKSNEFKIPKSLQAEHTELHEELAKAIAAGGKVSEAAKTVAALLHAHFEKEEEYALPPLGLLSELAQGRVTPEMRSAIVMADKLKADHPHMLQEHKDIVVALRKLIAAAKQENKLEHARFAEKLMLHAQNEEEVLYPAAILVGEYLKFRLGELKR